LTIRYFQGVEVIEDQSEYTTDFQKCIEEVEKHHLGVKDPPVIVLGGLSGRLDQTTHVLSLLQKLRLRATGSHGRDEDANTSAWRGSDFKVYMGDQLISHSKGQDLYDSQKRGKGTRDIKVVSENCVAWVLDKVSLYQSEGAYCRLPNETIFLIRESTSSMSTMPYMVKPAEFYR
jgi:hypothetical protein